jgi:ubiquinone/menaquinone biosynthesis C-methylase UbiE
MKTVEASFSRSWEGRKESYYNHWIRGAPRNQIQLAFRRHWLTFQQYLPNLPVRSVLEVGCGRGTISAYFADAGFEVTLVDTSERVLNIARRIFRANCHPAQYVVGDAFRLALGSDRYGLCVSIGLLEHFDDIGTILSEQLRVLAPGGVMLVYVVPERMDSIQRHFNWLNRSLKAVAALRRSNRRGPAIQQVKEPLYRNGLTAAAYVANLRKLGCTDVEAYGVYPLPMISHSPEFPFSLLPRQIEKLLVQVFSAVLGIRGLILRKDPWVCREETGQAFVIAARKPR